MDIARAKELLTALADGIDPFTGELFPRDHICNHPDIIRALHQILGSTQEIKKAPVRPMEANLGHRQNKTSWWMNFILE